MIKKIKRLLEVGEETKESDLLYALESYSNRWEKIGNITKAANRPISRETLVLELPPIPEGFRLLTKEDKANKLKGQFKHLNFSDFSWKNSNATNTSYYEDDSCCCIIKPKQKGFTIKDVAPGMSFFLGKEPYGVSQIHGDNLVGLCDFGVVTLEALNQHFSYLDSDGVITPCSEYQG